MLGNPNWFTYRLAGWGIAPKTWQGWVYVGGFLALLFGAMWAPVAEGPRNVLVATLVGLFVADALVIWVQMGKHQDERAQLHQLIIERNCSVAAVLTVVAAGAYQVCQGRNGYSATLPVDPALLVIVGVMAFTKLCSGLYLRWRM